MVNGRQSRLTQFFAAIFARIAGMVLRILLAIVLAALAQTAQAQSGPVPLKPDPPGRWRVMTYFDFTTKWSCRDRQPRTPICAIELRQACSQRGTLDLCRRVLPRMRDPEREEPGWGSPGSHRRFRVEKARWLTKAEVDRIARNEDRPWARIGDLLVIVRVLHCATMDAGCPHERRALKHAYLLRRVDGLWELVGWKPEIYGYD